MVLVLMSTATILTACGLSDLWKYVCNSMECHVQCCRDFISCDLKTNEIEIEPDENNNCTFVELLSHCCMERNDDD